MCCAFCVERQADSLPDDIEALRALALNAMAQRGAAITQRDTFVPGLRSA